MTSPSIPTAMEYRLEAERANRWAWVCQLANQHDLAAALTMEAAERTRRADEASEQRRAV